MRQLSNDYDVEKRSIVRLPRLVSPVMTRKSLPIRILGARQLRCVSQELPRRLLLPPLLHKEISMLFLQWEKLLYRYVFSPLVPFFAVYANVWMYAPPRSLCPCLSLSSLNNARLFHSPVCIRTGEAECTHNPCASVNEPYL